MSVVLKSIDDPRDNLSKLSRYELCQIAKSHGVAEITYSSELQLPDMILKLREKGITAKAPDRPLGQYKPVVLGLDGPPLSEAVEEDHPAPATPAPEKAISDMSMTELRMACKQRGIKMVRTDNLHTLREKLQAV